MKTEQDNFSKLIERAKTAKLTERERAAIFLTVDAYVKSHPLSAESGNFREKYRKFIAVKSPFSIPFLTDGIRPLVSAWHIHSARSLVAVFVVAVVIIGSGTSFAAQGSLPGDFLYPVRVNFNEEIKAVFLSDIRRPVYEIERLKTRVEEAKTLIAQDRMSDDIRNKIAVKVNSHISNVKKEVDGLTKNGDLKTAFEISNVLETSLKESESAISEELVGKEDAVEKELSSVKDIIRESREILTIARENAEEQILVQQTDDDSIKTIAEAKRQSVRKELDEINKEILTRREQATLTQDADSTAGFIVSEYDGVVSINVQEPSRGFDTELIQKLLAQGENLFDLGDEKLNASDFNAAFSFFSDALDVTAVIEMEMDSVTEDFNDEIDKIISDLEFGEQGII